MSILITEKGAGIRCMYFFINVGLTTVGDTVGFKVGEAVDLLPSFLDLESLKRYCQSTIDIEIRYMRLFLAHGKRS